MWRVSRKTVSRLQKSQKNKPLLNENIFLDLSSDYRNVTRFAQNGVPTPKKSKK